MKILVFSDTHGDYEAFKKMLAQVQDIDQIYCLGDSGFSESFMVENDILSVRGNYPFAPKYPMDIKVEWAGIRFLMTHGHKYRVKFGMSKLRQIADLLRMDVCMFGHTHRIYLKKEDDLILLNPGALSFQRSHLFPSYAKIVVEVDRLQIQIINLTNQQIVKYYNEDRHE